MAQKATPQRLEPVEASDESTLAGEGIKMEGTTNVIVLPGAAVQPVVNPVLRGRRARGGKVTLACDLVRRRYQRTLAAREAAAANETAAAYQRGYEMQKLESALAAALLGDPVLRRAVMDVVGNNLRFN